MLRSDRSLSPVVAVAAIVAMVALQQLPLLGSRGVWWADEARHAAVLDEMTGHGAWLALQLNGSFYPDKPPIWFWLLGMLKTLTGWDSATVLFSGLASSVLAYALALWHMARRITGHEGVALAAVAIALSGGYFVFAAHYARMDFLFSALIFLAWSAFFRAAGPTPDRAATLAGFAFATVALLVKGPFGLALPLAAFILHLGLNGRLSRLADRSTLTGLGIAVGVCGLWLASLALSLGPDTVRGLLQGQVIDRATGHSGAGSNPLRYLLFLPLMLLPWIAVLLAPMRPRAALAADQRDARVWLIGATLTGLAVLSVVGEKHEYYLLPLLGPISVLIAGRVLRLTDDQRMRVTLGIAAVFLLLGIALLGAPFLPVWDRIGPPLSDLPLALRVAALIALVAGLAAIWLRTARIGALIGLVLLSQSAFAAVALHVAIPHLDRLLSPEVVAAPMRPLIATGHAPVVVHGIDGVFQHALGQRYRQLRSTDTLWEQQQANPRAVIAIEAAQWHRLAPDDGPALGLVACPRLIGTHFVIVVTPPAPDTPPIQPGTPCPTP